MTTTLLRRPVDAFAAAWVRFWFTPQPASTLTVMRVMIGVTTFAWAVSILPDLATFYFDDGLFPEPTYAEHRIGLFQWFTSDTAVVVVYVALVLASLALMAGRGVRVAAPVLWLTMASMQQGAPNALNAGDLLLRVWTTYLAVFALLTPARFLRVPVFGERAGDGSRTWPLAPAWLVRVAQIQLTIIYPATVIAKLDGDTWREGTAALYALGLVDFERFWVPEVVRESLVVGNLMTWFTLGVEFALPFLLWTRRTRRLGLVLGVGMHLGFDYTMRLGFFLPAMLVGYLAFVRPDEVERPLRWVGGRIDRLRRPRPQEASRVPVERAEEPEHALVNS